MRITIRFKIFGIALIMVLLMAGVSLINMRQTADLRDAFGVLAKNYFTAFAEISHGELANRTASFINRRLMLAYADDNTPTYADFSPDSTEDLQNSLRGWSVIAGESFKKGGAILSDSESHVRNPREAHDLARIILLFNQAMDIRKDLLPKLAEGRVAMAAGKFAEAEASEIEVDRLSDSFIGLLSQVEKELRIFVDLQAEDFHEAESTGLLTSIIALALAISLGLIGAYLLARSLTQPVRRLLDGTLKVQEGNFDLQIPVTTKDEIGHLTMAFNHMIGELKTKDRIRETFGKYVDPKIVSGLIDAPELSRGEGERRVMTVSFTDLEGFTKLGEGLTPVALVRVINFYLTEMSRAIHRHGGIIDKFIGDAVMAYWGPPFVAAESQVEQACAAALDEIESFGVFRTKLPELMGLRRTVRKVNVRIGIATGEVVIGDIGSDVARNYTVLGDTVNIAARLEGVNKVYGTRILLAEDVAALVMSKFLLREIDMITVAGKTEPERIYELVGHETADARGLSAYADGLAAWRAGDWVAARAAFTTCLTERPNDGPAQVFLDRIAVKAQESSGVEWDGIWHLNSK